MSIDMGIVLAIIAIKRINSRIARAEDQIGALVSQGEYSAAAVQQGTVTGLLISRGEIIEEIAMCSGITSQDAHNRYSHLEFGGEAE